MKEQDLDLPELVSPEELVLLLSEKWAQEIIIASMLGEIVLEQND